MAENLLDLQKYYPWLNSQFFGEILEKENPTEKITVENVHLKPALNFGENYASQMIRATVRYHLTDNHDSQRSDEKRFVIKALVTNEAMAKLTKEYRLFDREVNVYKYIMPEVEKLLQSIGDNTKLAPKCYTASADECYLVFEDLSTRHYKNTDRRNGLDMNHYKLILTKLAKWHATTALLHSENFPHLSKFIESVMYQENQDEMKRLVTNCVESAARLTQTIPGYNGQITSKLNKFAETGFAKICQLVKPDTNSFIALTHGDLWANNTMYSYDTNNSSYPNDALLVDFQIGGIGPAIMDLAYTLYTSSHSNIKDPEWDLLLQHYHEELRETLIKLKYSKEIPTLTDIQVQFLTKGVTMLPISLIVVAVRHFEEADENTNSRFIGDTEEDAEFRYMMLANPKGQKDIKFLLEYFDRKGLLEI